MSESHFPLLRQTVIDTTDARRLAEFYRQLLGYEYRPGDEPPTTGDPDGADWLVLREPGGTRRIAFQQVERLEAPTWPEGPIPQQLHLDLSVESAEELLAQKERVLGLGASVLRDRFDDPEEPLFVFADPQGHPFCIFVA